MIIKDFQYGGYLVEIHKHFIYHDFEYVIKTLDEHTVVGTSTHTYEDPIDAEASAMLLINNL
jgi:hypothetical protein